MTINLGSIFGNYKMSVQGASYFDHLGRRVGDSSESCGRLSTL